MKKIAIVLASMIVVACASTPNADSSKAPKSSVKDSSTVAAASTSSVSEAELELNKLAAEIDALQKQSNYFDYNKSVIKPEYLSVLRKEAAFINAHQNDFVTLEGNADERGSEQYNLDLSGKRADAVKASLVKFGVSASQIKTVSLGKSKPRLACHDEKCWKENRRVDFIHKLG